jgi:hypothetical protein
MNDQAHYYYLPDIGAKISLIEFDPFIIGYKELLIYEMFTIFERSRYVNKIK